ncbi:hypothetical protein [Flavobacterium sp.]|nr:hypothetical protein [Flavobacterium sp.]
MSFNVLTEIIGLELRSNKMSVKPWIPKFNLYEGKYISHKIIIEKIQE